ncbi:uncharacterized protein V1510DRAFT_409773 [Dipodascopsis tothii]|uniref:uncharacterized protein n=1 Tax=Dipodascopsis tothii TaxID=44089 RepID=UPI0034CDA15D
MSTSKLQKTLERVKQRIADKEFYEAQQALRTVVARYVRQGDYEEAVELLFEGTQVVLRAGEGGSGGDLACLLIETFNNGKLGVTASTRAQVVQLFALFRPDEPRRKAFVQAAVQWANKTGGDRELHHVFGKALAEEDEPYEAEKHLLLGTAASAEVLGQMEFDWFMDDDEDDHAPFYAARAVLGYLAVGSIAGARRALDTFVAALTASGRVAAPEPVTGTVGSVAVFASEPLLNFFQLLIAACQRPSADLYRRLKAHYRAEIAAAGGLDDALDRIGERFFGIRARTQGNLLQDLMGSFLGPAPPARPALAGPDVD